MSKKKETTKVIILLTIIMGWRPL